ncbi:MAG: GNAT family N-acetyltransferase [Anaerolineales bacterium]|nr:GNAT family N-acetyltransferase [Anaerolineales bacterium]
MSSLIQVRDAPAIPGLTFRRFRGPADYPAMVAILDACNIADHLDYINTVEEIAFVFAHLTNCDPVRDMLFAEVNGATIAFSRLWWADEDATRLYISLGFIHPAWRRKGLGATMLRYDENHLREIARAHAAPEKIFRVWATDQEYGALALFAQAGYTPVRHYVLMLRGIDTPLPDAPMPEGLQVRPAQPDHIRAIWDAQQEARRDHWGYRPATEQDFHRWTTERLFAPELWQVAWDGDQIAGMVLNRIDREQNAQYHRQRGYTQGVFVRRPWRQRGLARALLTTSIQMFKQMGMEETALGVDTQNPHGALNLYESVGYHAIKRHTFFNKNFLLKDKLQCGNSSSL